ncbi:MAG: thermonuclease family protein, partial [Pseudomonadota bacterium]
AICQPAQYVIEGTVIKVDDGDTVIMQVVGSGKKTIRLASIDSPEAAHTQQERGRVGQPYSAKSTAYLTSLVLQKTVQGNCFEQDKYGRDVCNLSIGNTWINAEMVRSGFAWANMSARGRYLRDQRLLQIEAAAHQAHAGLWADDAPVAPWVWRDSCWKQHQCSTSPK